jgi:hypothetical protein
MVIADQVDAQLMETAQLDGSGGSLANVLGNSPSHMIPPHTKVSP